LSWKVGMGNEEEGEKGVEVASEGDGEREDEGVEEGVRDGGKSIQDTTSSSRFGNRQSRS